jgi:hypothetical protein
MMVSAYFIGGPQVIPDISSLKGSVSSLSTQVSNLRASDISGIKATVSDLTVQTSALQVWLAVGMFSHNCHRVKYYLFAQANLSKLGRDALTQLATLSTDVLDQARLSLSLPPSSRTCVQRSVFLALSVEAYWCFSIYIFYLTCSFRPQERDISTLNTELRRLALSHEAALSCLARGLFPGANNSGCNTPYLHCNASVSQQ